ncbi:MAG TPA: AmmeMemoRadiSam system protein A [bacterium]|nr:AmmeMemoRadiSam system protein A [bacterium]HPN45404.1 AmmeMemoRadiSam system protein A [bacterium]
MPENRNNNADLSIEEKKQLLNIARETITLVVNGKKPKSYTLEAPVFTEKRGAFVTIHKRHDLRGCIGLIRGVRPLLQTIIEMASAAALNDPRFDPVRPDELTDLEIEISVLTPMRRISSVEEITPGEHGLYIENGFYSGLLLPQVAGENGWDRKTFLEHTCRKAGLPMNAWKDSETKIFIFSANVFNDKLLA